MALKHMLFTGDTGFVVSKTKYATIGEIPARAAGTHTLTNFAAETSKKSMAQFCTRVPTLNCHFLHAGCLICWDQVRAHATSWLLPALHLDARQQL